MLKSLFSSKPLDNIMLNDVCFVIRHIKRKNMKRMILRVVKKNEIRISTSSVSKKRVEAFIHEQKAWILRQHEGIKEPFQEGDSFYYLAETYTIHHHDKALELHDGKIYLNPLKAKQQSDVFYKKAASQYLSARILIWKERMQIEFTSLEFRFAKRRWGSCNSKGIITLNPYMMKLNYEMIDYIIVHELAHLTHMNHSKSFYALVEHYIPNYIMIQNQIKNFTVSIV